jgi:hypothetical protein
VVVVVVVAVGVAASPAAGRCDGGVVGAVVSFHTRRRLAWQLGRLLVSLRLPARKSSEARMALPGERSRVEEKACDFNRARGRQLNRR